MSHPLERIVLRVLDDHAAIMGTGFVVADRLAVTCAHVVRDAGSARGKPLRVQPHLAAASMTATVLPDGWSDTEDVAFLALPEDVGPPIRLAAAASAVWHEFASLGYPQGTAVAERPVDGRIQLQVRVEGRTRRLLQLTGEQADPGLSGAPIYDRESRRVIGMFTALADVNRPPAAPAFRVGFATTADTIVGLRPDVLGLDAAAAAVGAPETVRRRLASYLTRFVWRGDELRRLEQCLVSDQRLVTLVGITGLGKTRLALNAVAEVTGQFADGVSYVDLVDASGTGMREVVTSALELTGDLDEIMRSRHALLVLDTCDRQVDSCRSFAERLLQNSADLRILAACQQPLAIDGEQKFELQPLGAPTREQLDAVRAKDTPAESFREMDAVRLFVDRARNQRYGYEPGPEDLLHIGDICHRLEGIPALIEMAARRMRGSPAQLAEKLEESLAVPHEHHPPRQQTVHAMLDWMYQSLEHEQERQLLRRLSVFAGGWTQAAAEAIAAGKPLSVEAVNHWLDRLADKSMVTIERSADPLRYRMLRTVRDDASARLEETVEAHDVRARHFDYYLAQAEASQPYRPGVREATWLATLEMEHDNVRTAFEWALANRETTRALSLVGALFWFWNFRGYVQEGRLRAEQALALKPARASRVRAQALYAAGTLAFLENERASAIAHLEASERMARAQRDERVLAYSLVVLGLLRADERPTEGLAHEYEALRLFQRLGDRWGEALARHDLANVLNGRGEGTAAREQYEESLQGFRAVASQWGQALALNNLGAIAEGDRRYPEAREHFREAADLHRMLQNKPYLAATLIRLGYLEKARDPREALALFRETIRLAHQIGNEWMLADSIFNVAQLAHGTGHTRQAACLLAALQARLDARPDAPRLDPDEFERWKAQARASLDAATFEAAWREGRALSLAQARTYALQDT